MGRVIVVVVVAGWLTLGSAIPAQQRSAQEKSEQKEPLVYTNADLPPAPAASSPPLTAPSPAAAPPVTSLPAIPTPAELRDKNGHGEGWWRLRASELDLLILDARIHAEKLHVDYVKGKTLVDPTVPARSQEAVRVLRELEAERDRLPEELRRAGGLPGWLRRGDDSLPSELLPSPVPEAPLHAEAITFSWQAVPQATFYIVEVQCSNCCGLLDVCDVRSLDVSGTSTRFPFDAGRSGRWRVRALDAAGFPGEWSSWDSFEHPPL